MAMPEVVLGLGTVLAIFLSLSLGLEVGGHY